LLCAQKTTLSSHRTQGGNPLNSAQPILQGLHDLTIVLSVILGFVVAGTIAYFIYVANMKLES